MPNKDKLFLQIARASSQLGFGASGAVARPKVCANLQVMRPSERQWKPRLRQALARYVPFADRATDFAN